jgi:hypothetical protein
MPDLMMIMEMIAPSQASREIWKIRKIPAATSVDAEMMESSVASSPELIRESEFTFLPMLFQCSPLFIKPAQEEEQNHDEPCESSEKDKLTFVH